MISRKETTVIFIMTVIFIFFTKDFYFFWDNVVQTAVPANFYFDKSFRYLYLPNDITTGHQPFFGMYLAAGWKLFGRTISISHWLMLPFVFGTAYQLLILIRFAQKDFSKSLFIYGICLANSVLLTQLSLLTFEIPHLFFFLATANAILRKDKLWIAIFFALLNLVSLRATMSAMGLVLYVFVNQVFIEKKFKFKEYLAFFPGVMVFLTFLFTFYIDHGWIVHNVVSKNWQNSSKYSDCKGIFKNIAIILWRLCDFGSIIFYVFFIWMLISSYSKKVLFTNVVLQILILAFCQFLIFCLFTVPYQNSIAHRYFLPFSIPFTIAVCSSIGYGFRNYRYLYAICLLFTIGGYFWKYPENIAKGWDAMPSHQSYYKMRKSAIDFLSKNTIPINEVSTGFPNTNNFKNIDLGSSNFRFNDINGNDEYIFYSNVFNLPDKIIADLYSNQFKRIYEISDGTVKIIIFKRK